MHYQDRGQLVTSINFGTSIRAGKDGDGNCRCDIRRRERVALQYVHLEALNATGQLRHPSDHRLESFELVVIQSHRRHGVKELAWPGR